MIPSKINSKLFVFICSFSQEVLSTYYVLSTKSQLINDSLTVA